MNKEPRRPLFLTIDQSIELIGAFRRAGLAQKAVAEEMGLRPPMLSRILNARVSCAERHRLFFKERFGVEISPPKKARRAK